MQSKRISETTFILLSLILLMRQRKLKNHDGTKLFILFTSLILFFSPVSGRQFELRDTAGMKWFKGNLHTHARADESDTSVEEIIESTGTKVTAISSSSSPTIMSSLYRPIPPVRRIHRFSSSQARRLRAIVVRSISKSPG